MSEASLKRPKPDTPADNTPLLLFIAIPEDPYYYAFTTPLTEAFTPEVIDVLNQSLPSQRRKGNVPGCTGPQDLDDSVWTRVPEGAVKDLTNIGKVVLGFFYE